MITGTILHPTVTNAAGAAFGVVVKKVSRMDASKRRAELESQEVPHPVIDPTTKKPMVDNLGRPIYAWRRPSPDSTFVYDNISSFIVGITNAPNGDDGKPLSLISPVLTPSDKDANATALWHLFDEAYDIPRPTNGMTPDKFAAAVAAGDALPTGDIISFGLYILIEWNKAMAPNTESTLFPNPMTAPSATT